MSSSDWAELGNSLAGGIVARAASGGFTAPNGGGSYVHAMNSLSADAEGAVGLYCNLANFNPTAQGASIRACIKRYQSAKNTGWSPLIFCMASGHDVDDNAYILGLEDRDPYRIVLVKGSLVNGIPDMDIEGNSYLRISSAEYQISDGLYHHLRLDATYQPTGDVKLDVYESDLSAHACTAPSWTAIGGMASFVDDAAGINSGSLPYTSGYGGWATTFFGEISVRSLFDHIQLIRQT